MVTKNCQLETLPHVVPKHWPVVPLGDVLTPSEEWADLQSDADYQEVTVKLWGKGVVLRRQVKGAEVAAKKRLIAHKDQFILSRIDARNGAFGLIPEDLDGAIVSNDFPVFNLGLSRVTPRFLAWMSKTQNFVEICKAASEGTTNRVRLKVDRFLTTEIPLPPLDEQRRIVARIEALAAKIEEARGLRQRITSEADVLWQSALTAAFLNAADCGQATTFGEVCEVVRGGSPRPAGSPVYYDGPTPFLKVADLTADQNKYLTTYTATIKDAGLRKTRYVESNTLMLTNSGATLGVPKIVSFPTAFNDGIQAFLNLREDISKEYLYYFFRSKTSFFREWIARGQGQPNLNTEMVRTMQFPLVSPAQQRRIVAYLDDLQAKVDALKRLQTETAAELDALLPSILDKAFKGEL